MFWKRFKLFKLLGFEVKIDASWIFIAILVTWSLASGLFPSEYPDLAKNTYLIMGLLGAFLLFFSIIFHEFSHSIVARKYGIPITGITLFIFGGVAEMHKEPETARSEFLMAIAGPIASLVLGAIFWALGTLLESNGGPVIFYGVFLYLGVINVVLAVFNMVPAFPLDGGRVFRSYLWQKTGNLRKATEKASKIGSGFGTAFMLAGALFFFTGNFIGGIWWVLIGLFLKNASYSSLRQMLLKGSLEGVPVSNFMSPKAIAIPAEVTVEEAVKNYFYKYHHKLFPVVSGDTVTGLIELKDIKDVRHDQWGETYIKPIIQRINNQNTLPPDMDALEALRRLQQLKRSRVLVYSKDKNILGVLTLKDMLDFFAMKADLEKS